MFASEQVTTYPHPTGLEFPIWAAHVAPLLRSAQQNLPVETWHRAVRNAGTGFSPTARLTLDLRKVLTRFVTSLQNFMVTIVSALVSCDTAQVQS